MKNSLKKENIRIFDIIFEESSTLAFSYQSSLEVRIQPWLPYLRVVLFRCYHMSRRSLRFFCMATQGFLCFGLTYYVIIKKLARAKMHFFVAIQSTNNRSGFLYNYIRFLCFSLAYYVIIKKPHSLRSCQFFDALFRNYTMSRRSLRFSVWLNRVFVF